MYVNTNIIVWITYFANNNVVIIIVIYFTVIVHGHFSKTTE